MSDDQPDPSPPSPDRPAPQVIRDPLAEPPRAAPRSEDRPGHERSAGTTASWSSSWGDSDPDAGTSTAATGSTAPPPAPASPSGSVASSSDSPPPPASSRGGGTRRTNLWITLGVLVVAVAAGAWWVLRPATVDVAVDGVPIANADAVLADAERQLQVIVDADQSSTTPGMSCHFAPNIEDRSGPRVLCGPVLLGISPPGQPWLAGQVNWGFPDGTVTGTFAGFDGTTTGDPEGLVRPDGRAPDETMVDPPTSGLRTDDGALITNVDRGLAATEQAVRDAATEAGASVGDDLHCWFAVRTAGQRRTTDGTTWCAPVLTVDSDPSEFWVSESVSAFDGETLSTAELSDPSVASLFTEALADVTLVRPDDLEPPTSTDLDLPDAAPVEVDFRAPVEVAVDDLATSAPTDGVLRTPDMAWTITGVATSDRIGRGPDAIIAPEGSELVVATSTFAPADQDGFLDPGTATLVVDGARQPFDDWSAVGEDTTAIVVAVPTGTQDVVVEVLGGDTTQGMSLVTGDKQPGFPPGIYRSTVEVGVGARLRASADLPGGEPAVVSVVVSSIQLAGYDGDLGWPDDEVFVRVAFAEAGVDTPCCDLPDLAAEFVPVLEVGGDVLEPVESDPDGATFAVPADARDVRVGLRVDATWTSGPGTGRATATAPSPIAVTLPS